TTCERIERNGNNDERPALRGERSRGERAGGLIYDPQSAARRAWRASARFSLVALRPRLSAGLRLTNSPAVPAVHWNPGPPEREPARARPSERHAARRKSRNTLPHHFLRATA